MVLSILARMVLGLVKTHLPRVGLNFVKVYGAEDLDPRSFLGKAVSIEFLPGRFEGCSLTLSLEGRSKLGQSGTHSAASAGEGQHLSQPQLCGESFNCTGRR